MKNELHEKILSVFRQCPVVTVCTVDGTTPRGRTMVVSTRDDLTLTTATFLSSRKVKEIKANPIVCVVSGLNPEKPNSPYATLTAKAEVLTDPETKKACWAASLAAFFMGPDDPEYAVLRLRPVRGEYWTFEQHEPDVLEFGA